MKCPCTFRIDNRCVVCDETPNDKELKRLREFLCDRYPTVLEEYLKLTRSPLEKAQDTVKQVIKAKKMAGDSKLVFKKDSND